MCSTFKLLLAAYVLEQADHQQVELAQTIAYAATDLLTNSPVTLQHLQQGELDLRELAAAAVVFSDNTAANLLLRKLGGPPVLTAFLRRIGDPTTRLDREETALNSNIAGDLRDTTTPAAMAATMAKLFAGNVLSAGSRAQLMAWLHSSATGLHRLRARLPRNWMVGDKTGTGANGAVNDVLVAWPESRKPIVAAVYLSESSAAPRVLEEAHAQIGAAIAVAFA
jgi:beta-lactamase class A